MLQWQSSCCKLQRSLGSNPRITKIYFYLRAKDSNPYPCCKFWPRTLGGSLSQRPSQLLNAKLSSFYFTSLYRIFKFFKELSFSLKRGFQRLEWKKNESKAWSEKRVEMVFKKCDLGFFVCLFVEKKRWRLKRWKSSSERCQARFKKSRFRSRWSCFKVATEAFEHRVTLQPASW